MNIAIFGYPKAGKTTLFSLLTGARIEVKAQEDQKRQPSLRTCPVPDLRLDRLAGFYPEKEKKPAVIELADWAGFSANLLRGADGLAHVVRGFVDQNIPHPKGKVEPREDIISMEEELALADLLAVESRLERLEKDLKKTKSPEGEKEKELLERLRTSLEQGESVRELALLPAEDKLLKSFAFLSQKPLLQMINLDEKDISLVEKPEAVYSSSKKKTAVLAFCGKIEKEILELEESEKEAFLREYGLHEFSASKFWRACLPLLDLVTFFTIGKEEVKAWMIPRDTPALQVAGCIHTDIQKGFIRAEVISWEELCQLGSLQTAKEKARVRLEGKEYIVQDGDVIYFRFSK